MKLYQKKRSGKIKILELTTDGAKLISTHGELGGKMQVSTKICTPMNVGRANETTPEEQAKLELAAKVVKEKKRGYSTKMPSKNDTVLQAKIDLDNIPQPLCPNKPIGQALTPKNVLEGKDTYGQRKHNGHCLILSKGKKKENIYTRRMENITAFVKDIPVIKEAMSRVPKGSMVLHECVFHHTTLNKEIPRYVQKVISKEDADKALAEYNGLLKLGTFKMIPLDMLFFKGNFFGDRDYLVRWATMAGLGMKVPDIIKNWKAVLDKAKKEKWEGFVLRVPGDRCGRTEWSVRRTNWTHWCYGRDWYCWTVRAARCDRIIRCHRCDRG